jgi:predicted transcriptional regulator
MLKISDLLVITRGNQSEVARMLRIQRGTLSNYMKKKKEHMIIERDGDYHLFANISEQYCNEHN